MKATDVIKRDHRAAEELFAKYKAASSEERKNMEEEIFKALDNHENMEDTYFYPALMEAAPDMPGLQNLEEEQAELKANLERIKNMSEDKEDEILKMMDTVLTHAKEEESEVLDPAETVLSEEQLEDLGTKMEPLSAVANA